MKSIFRSSPLLSLITWSLSIATNDTFAQNFTWDGRTDNVTAVAWDGGAGLVTWPGVGNNAIIPSGSVAVDAPWPVNTITMSGGLLGLVGANATVPGGFALNLASAANPASVLVNGGTLTRSFIQIGSGTGMGSLTVNNGGTVSSTGEIWLGSNATDNGFGAIQLTNGTINTGSWFAIGRGGDGTAGFDTRGTLLVNGGTLNVGAAGNLSIGAFRIATTATSTMHLESGTVNVARGMFVGENANGIFDMSGGNLNISTSVTDVGLQIRGIMNLRGGTVLTPWIMRRAGGVGILNIHGGLLQARTDNATFLQGLGQVNLFGNATIDTNNRSITINQPLLEAGGSGVSAVGLVISGGSGYTSAPIVEISGGGGSGATARAIVTDGSVTEIEITNPGTNYVSAPTFTLVGGGGSGAAIDSNNAELVANNTGGLTKVGQGTLTLGGASNFASDTRVVAGTLIVNGSLASGNIQVDDGASFGGSGSTAGSLTMQGNHQFVFNPAAATAFLVPVLEAEGSTITVIPSGTLTAISNKPILTADTFNASSSNFVSGHPRLSLSVANNQLLATYSSANLTWSGADELNPSFWDNNLSANWSDGQTFFGADRVTFDDSALAASPVEVEITEAVAPSEVIFANTAKNYALSGNAISGTTGVLVSGGGLVRLANTNTYTGLTTVRSGTLQVTGSLATGSNLVIADTAGKATFISSGTVNRNAVLLGTVSGASGAYYQTGGDVSTTVVGGGSFSVGLVNGGYGYAHISGGTLGTEEIAIGTWGTQFGANNGGSGMVEITGGTVTNRGWFVMNRSEGATAVSQRAALHVTGGSLTYAGDGLVANWGGSGQVQHTQITVSGTGSIATTNNTPINLSRNGNAANTAVLNLNGGTVTLAAVTGTRGFVNCNGGTLRANSANANFLAVNTARVFPGGAVIDTNSHNITIAQSLRAPTGNGISATGLFVTGSGYVSPPLVEITGGGGFGATAIASIDASGNLIAITITNPGVDYTSSPTFTLIGGGGTGSITGSATLVANSSGGLTKQGAGTLTMTGSHTYSGNTTVSAGTLSLGNGSANSNLSDTADVFVATGATLQLNFTGEDTVDELWLGGVRQLPGLYNTGHPSGLLTGTGALRVTGGAVVSDYDSWASGFQPPLGQPTADDDGDGLSNFSEYAFGLDPQSGASSNPISQPLDRITGTFKYTRRATPQTSGLTYVYESSTTLTGTWPTFTPLSAISNNASPVEEITVTVPNALLAEPRIFLRVKSNQSN
jgi:autotransporter-associated beta strand protein